jgi:hypothetical protein
VVGSVLRADLVDKDSPIARGYDDSFALYSSSGLAFDVSSQTIGNRGIPAAQDYQKPTGRGGPDEPDIPEGRPYQAPPALPSAKPWQAMPLNAEQKRNNLFLIPSDQRPDVIVRWADANQLLISGLLDNGGSIAQHAAVVDAHYGKGNVLLFANNPMWRGETVGSYALLLNAIVNYDRLH